MVLLTLVRHGQSTYNFENRFTGNLDVPLTALGEQEAREAGKKLKSFAYAVAFTSMLVRAQESLTIILKEIGREDIPIFRSAALDERKYGALQGLNKAETIAQYGEAQVERWRRSYAVRPPGGESLEDTASRALDYYAATIEPKLKLGENTLIVAHGNSLRALMMHLEKISPEEIPKVEMPTGSPRHYELRDDLTIGQVRFL
jgi:2,3-bisphosphoglycerate-dependent phosphoglycerate mutase